MRTVEPNRVQRIDRLRASSRSEGIAERLGEVRMAPPRSQCDWRRIVVRIRYRYQLLPYQIVNRI